MLLGLQWGDEGKGKIVDVLTKDYDIIARFQGGANAGHTIIVGDSKYVLHLIPSGILYPDVLCILGNGVVVNPGNMLAEMDGQTAKTLLANRRQKYLSMVSKGLAA